MSPTPFPHLMPVERFFWAQFLARYGSQWDSFQYDLHVGEGRPVNPDQPQYIQDMARHLSLKRIDVVGWQGRQPTIFEVDPAGGRKVIGALELYRWLFQKAYPDLPAPHIAAVVQTCDPDCQRFLEAIGAQVFLVPAEPARV